MFESERQEGEYSLTSLMSESVEYYCALILNLLNYIICLNVSSVIHMKIKYW